MKKMFYVVILVLFLFGCSDVEKVDNDIKKDELKIEEIK